VEANMGTGWLFALIPLLLGAVFFAIGFTGIRRARTLRRTGATAEGRVVRLATSSGNNGTLYHPVARWHTPDGVPHEHTSRIGKTAVLNFRPGTPVRVHYNPKNPTQAAIAGYDGAGPDHLFALLGALLTAATFTVLTAAFLTR
ncbi:DUF3592 domain-containing protein, partial [Streptomyces sp. MAR4 CNX-425]|uniref:DUF3592 domain-containing protein n=1 Tax=Streptomyces sp. MAR4 CNX-425 TaxID=3406343 RepID=UPI003B5047EB